MKNKVTLSAAERNQLIENTIGMMELDHAVLNSVSGAGPNNFLCRPSCGVAD